MADAYDVTMEQLIPVLIPQLGIQKTDKAPEHFTVSRQAENDIRNGLVSRIKNVMDPSFSRMYLSYLDDEDVLDLYVADQETEAVLPYAEGFIRKYTDNDSAYFKETLPRIYQSVEDAAEQYAFVIAELLERLDHDYEEVCDRLLDGKKFHAIEEIIADSGDLHNHGHATSILTTDAGKIVYKPHDIRIDAKAEEMTERFFADVLKTPKVCVYEDYGFAEFIENIPASTEEEAKQYFWRLGGFAAIVQLLGSSDLHHSNLLASHSYPIIIDYELLVTPLTGAVSTGLRRDLKFSLLYSSLMPSRRGTIEMSVLFAKDEDNKATPIVNGVPENVIDHPDDFMDGFETVYRRIMSERKEIEAYINGMTDAAVRHIYRGTNPYTQLLKKTREPAWSNDPNLKEALYQELSVAGERSGNTTFDDITAYETEALLRGDIPYFYTLTDSRDLYADGHVVNENFFAASAIEHVLQRLAYFSEEDLAFEKELLNKSMTRVLYHVRQDETMPMADDTKAVSDETLLKEAEDIFRKIRDDAVYTPSGIPCWFAPNYFLETGMDLVDGGLLHGTIGHAVFFAALHASTKDEEIRQQTEELIRIIVERLKNRIESLEGADKIWPNTESISYLSGISGKLLGLYLISQYLETDEYNDLYPKMIALMDKMDLDQEKNDIFSGAAGALKVLCTYDDLFNAKGGRELSEKLADHLLKAADIIYGSQKLWRTTSRPWAVSGAGHGQSGVASAMYFAGQRLNRQDLIDAAMAGFDFEDKVYSRTLHAWPDRRKDEVTDHYLNGYCSGGPGIGINALQTGYEGSESILARAIDSVQREPLNYRDFLCCGSCAGVEFMLEAGHKLNRKDLADDARSRMAMILDRKNERGEYTCINSDLNNIYSSTLLYGTAGIGYEMLRLIDPDKIKSVLI